MAEPCAAFLVPPGSPPGQRGGVGAGSADGRQRRQVPRVTAMLPPQTAFMWRDRKCHPDRTGEVKLARGKLKLIFVPDSS